MLRVRKEPRQEISKYCEQWPEEILNAARKNYDYAYNNDIYSHMRKSELKSLIKEVVRTCLESPDNVVFKKADGKSVVASWDQTHVVAVILISDQPQKDYYAYLEKQKKVISSNKEHEKRWQEWQKNNPNDRLSQGFHCTHGDVISRIHAAIPELRSTWKRGTNARLYTLEGHYIMAFWEVLRKVREYAPQVQEFFKDIKVNFDTTEFEPSGYQGNYISGDELLGTAAAAAKYNTQQMKDKEELHLLAPDEKKKAMMKRGMAYARKDQEMARKAKMPVAQVRQMYPGMAVAENKS